MDPLKLGLVQMAMHPEKAANLSQATDRVKEAASRGARVICLPELFLTPYFCRTQDAQHFSLAEPVPGPTTQVFSDLAKTLEVVIIVPLFEKRAQGVYSNTAVAIDADGALLGCYRKMHIPQDPGFEEKFYFTPGDQGYPVWQTRYGKLGVLVCWDQWYPEAARLSALAGADLLLYPTAIGWLQEEGASLGKRQHTAWQTVQRGHAIANGCYVAAVNRTGIEGETVFWGQSFVSDFYGSVLSEAPAESDCILICELDLNEIESFRNTWPFFRDRRIDSYAASTRKTLDNG